MNFKERKTQQPSIKVRAGRVPIVHINRSALNKMFIYTDEVQDEVGWLGTAYKLEDNSYLIDDVFLFKQEVHGTTTEITSEGLEEFAMELLQLPDGVEIWNNMKMWGHSHVRMGITPSGQDNSQMEEFSKVGHDFFIRLICNKLGELSVDVYEFDRGLETHNAKWYINENIAEETPAEAVINEIEQLQAQIKELEAQKKAIEDAVVVEQRAPIKEEIKGKVSKIVTPAYKAGVYNYGKNYNYGYNKANVSSGKKAQKNDNQIDNVKYYVSDFFTGHELKLYSNSCFSKHHLKQELELDGWEDTFTDSDINKIWKEVQKRATWYQQGEHGYY